MDDNPVYQALATTTLKSCPDTVEPQVEFVGATGSAETAMRQNPGLKLKKKYSAELKTILGRGLTTQDGMEAASLAASEKRLKLKLPGALKIYYEMAGRLAINREHNRLYQPRELTKLNGKLVFMEENQTVVFWGMDIKTLNLLDPEVFQASNETPVHWYSEGLAFSDFIIKMWRWLRALD